LERLVRGHFAFDQVLAREFVPLVECNVYTKKFLKALAWLLTHQLSATMYAVGIAKEYTASSPLMIHFGHCIAGSFHPKIAQAKTNNG